MTSSFASSRRLSFSARFFSRVKERFAIRAGKVKHFFHVDHLLHDLGLVHVPWNAVEHERVDVGFEFVRVDRGVDRLFPELDRDVVRNELAFARVFEKRLADLGARVDRAENVAAGAMIEARDRAERFALGAFAAARGAEKNKRVVFLMSEMRYTAGSTGDRGKRESTGLAFASTNRIDVDATPRAIEAHAAVDQREDRVIATESDVFSRQELCPALANDDVAGDDRFAAKFFHAQPLADAVAAVLDAALSFFMSHWKNVSIKRSELLGLLCRRFWRRRR